jgi:hypothetical protein
MTWYNPGTPYQSYVARQRSVACVIKRVCATGSCPFAPGGCNRADDSILLPPPGACTWHVNGQADPSGDRLFPMEGELCLKANICVEYRRLVLKGGIGILYWGRRLLLANVKMGNLVISSRRKRCEIHRKRCEICKMTA